MSDAAYTAMLSVAIEEARLGLSEGGIPIGAALFDRTGKLLGRGHNRRVQHGDPSVHGETDAFRNAGRRRTYQDTIMVTTLAPCSIATSTAAKRLALVADAASTRTILAAGAMA